MVLQSVKTDGLCRYHAILAEKARRIEIAYALALSAYRPARRAKRARCETMEEDAVHGIGLLPSDMLRVILRMVFHEGPRETLTDTPVESFSV